MYKRPSSGRVGKYPIKKNPFNTSGGGRGSMDFTMQLAKAAAGASGSPYVRATYNAVQAARTIQKAYRAYKAGRTPMARGTTHQASRLARYSGVSTGKYRGLFKKPRRPKGGKGGNLKYLKTGSMLTKEIYGSIDDADVVMLGHSTFPRSELAKVIAEATLRKLFAKAGFVADAVDQEIPAFAYNDADGFQVSIVRVKEGTITPTTYFTINNDTIATVAVNCGLIGFLETAMISNGNSGLDFDRIALYTSDRNGVATNTRLAAELNLRTEVLELKVSSAMTIQNRTKSATGSTSTDVIDNQPLRGYLYQCAGSVPQTTTMGRNVINTMELTGLQLIRGAEAATVSGGYLEPVHPKTFTNCYKSSRVSLQPGDIKKSYITSVWKGYWNNLVVGKLQARLNNVAPDSYSYAPGKCQVFALEEILNSGSTNKITCNYELERKIGAVLYKSKTAPMVPPFEQVRVDNLTP